MSIKPHRILTMMPQGENIAWIQRELYSITRNKQGDYRFTLDGGEVWQFTVNNQCGIETPPTVENVTELGFGTDGATHRPDLRTAVLVLNKGFYTGNLRILPKEVDGGGSAEPKPRKPGRRKPGGKNHDLDGHDKWAVECLIKEIALGKRPRGTPRMEDTEVMRKLSERVKTHSTLKHTMMPSKRALQGWVSRVRRGGAIPGSIAGRAL